MSLPAGIERPVRGILEELQCNLVDVGFNADSIERLITEMGRAFPDVGLSAPS